MIDNKESEVLCQTVDLRKIARQISFKVLVVVYNKREEEQDPTRN